LAQNAVKPEKSAKRTVTSLRSPAGNLSVVLSSADEVNDAASPQDGQNLASAGKSAPHCEQRFANPAPQLKQKRAVERFSTPQASQNITHREIVSQAGTADEQKLNIAFQPQGEKGQKAIVGG